MTLSPNQRFTYNDLLTIVQQIPTPMFISEVTDAHHITIKESNLAVVKITGYPKQELLKMSPYDLIDKDLLRKASFDQKKISEDTPFMFESIITKKDGSVTPVLFQVIIITLSQNKKYSVTLIHDITDKRNTEVLLEKTHQQLESLFVYNPDLIFMLNKQGDFTNVNPANERILLYTKHEMLLMNYNDIIYEEDLESTNQKFNEVLQNATVQVELRVYNKAGEILTLDITAVPTINDGQVTGVIGVARDITFEKEMAKQLQESEQRYRSIYENNIDAVLSFDLNGCFSYINKATEQLMGYTAKELIGTPFLPHIIPEERKRTAEEYAKVEQGIAVQYETCMLNKQQEFVYLHVTVIPIIVDGKLTGVHCLGKDITEKKKFEEKLNYMAYHDYLTALPNQHYFHHKLKELMETEHSLEPFSIFFLDLDRFKSINDSLGHEYGDKLLKKVAERLQWYTPGNATVFRYGGDEFIVLLQQTTLSKTTEVADQLMTSLSQPYDLEGIDIVTTPSIGISVYPQDAQDSKTLIKKADNAMYHAKRMGKSNYQFYHDSMHSKIQGNIELESLLRKAIKRNEFSLFYQPQIGTKSNQIYGAEALIRWNSHELGMISPAEFIPLAEESGLIVPIGEWVIREACQQVKNWQCANLPLFPVSVNLSIRQFYQSDLIPMIRKIIEETGIEPHYLELEITETMAMEAESATIILQELKNTGVKIAMDDFGTGYSSLNYLKKFPIDHLKIDQSFVKDISYDKDDKDIVSTIIVLAHNLNMLTIAEGVETAEHVAFLKEHKCDVLQGYHFSKPLPPQEFESWLKNWVKSENE
ncbi:sensor domain-containing protein [Gracilibacillus kekensis]|uniref:PAS domain S-box-containing protein/diguanylate cyclase (GGDEF) domain-containing protein n=1 Tax=Gracilibacillus kekensis TaxID=1027249 RepID=A0A1M7QAT1_9BACI|nr:bifunctional diguanylate cyclase/phosphodiesterase [Gracilibacillus kekensis]SHN27854.1 PAS domain S-box-containing protein/diguanylate cyclase (GGDEF) domain-containing protein [Gracilibacillus kekensis]